MQEIFLEQSPARELTREAIVDDSLNEICTVMPIYVFVMQEQCMLGPRTFTSRHVELTHVVLNIVLSSLYGFYKIHSPKFQLKYKKSCSRVVEP